MWADKDWPATPEQRRQVVIAQELCDEMLPGWVEVFPSYYFQFPAPGLVNVGVDVLLWDWSWKMPAHFDTTGVEWIALALPKEVVPDRFSWTGMQQDDVVSQPFVDVYLPMVKDGVFLGSVKPLCDVMMPELDGYGALAALRIDEETARIPFIFLTAKGEKTDVRAGMNPGADDYLTKPADIDDLLRAIAARLARREEHAAGAGAPNFDSAQPLIEKLSLTPRESEVLLWVAQGKANGDIALILSTTESTVKKHLEHIFEKLGVENRGGAWTLAGQRPPAPPHAHLQAVTRPAV